MVVVKLWSLHCNMKLFFLFCCHFNNWGKFQSCLIRYFFSLWALKNIILRKVYNNLCFYTHLVYIRSLIDREANKNNWLKNIFHSKIAYRLNATEIRSDLKFLIFIYRLYSFGRLSDFKSRVFIFSFWLKAPVFC